MKYDHKTTTKVCSETNKWDKTTTKGVTSHSYLNKKMNLIQRLINPESVKVKRVISTKGYLHSNLKSD